MGNTYKVYLIKEIDVIRHHIWTLSERNFLCRNGQHIEVCLIKEKFVIRSTGSDWKVNIPPLTTRGWWTCIQQWRCIEPWVNVISFARMANTYKVYLIKEIGIIRRHIWTLSECYFLWCNGQHIEVCLIKKNCVTRSVQSDWKIHIPPLTTRGFWTCIQQWRIEPRVNVNSFARMANTYKVYLIREIGVIRQWIS